MILYRGCTVYRKADGTIIGKVDIETDSVLLVNADYIENINSGAKAYTVSTKTYLDFVPVNHNITVPNQTDGNFKITAFTKQRINRGNVRPKFLYTLTLN